MKRQSQRLMLVLMGLMLGLLLSEGLARLIDAGADAQRLYPVPPQITQGLLTPAENGEWLHPTPNFQGHFRSLGISHPIQLNALGLRSPPPQEGERGWLVLGDSFVMGLQVPEAQTLTAQLTQLRGQPFWNAGVDSYNTRQAMLWYQTLAPQLDLAGIVLVFFHGNDWKDNSQDAALNPNLPPRPAGMSLQPPVEEGRAPSLYARLLLRSYLLSHIELARRRASINVTNNGLREEIDLLTAPDFGRHVPPTRRALETLHRAATDNGHPLLIVSAPPLWSINDEVAESVFRISQRPDAQPSAQPYDRLQQIGAALGVPVCDLRPILQASSKEAYLEFDGHWSARGHALVAQAIDECLPQ